MAITYVPDWPRGFTPYVGAGGDSQFKAKTMKVLGSYGVAIPGNCFVWQDTTGGSVKKCVDATDYTGKIVGVAAHSLPASSSDQDLLVYTTDNLFVGQMDDASANADTIAEILGASFAIVGNQSVNWNGFSTGELDTSSRLAAPTGAGGVLFTVVELARALDNRLATAGSATERTGVIFRVAPLGCKY